MGKLKVVIDKNVCIGCAACVAACEEVYALDDTSSKAFVTNKYSKENNENISWGEVSEELKEKVKEGEKTCPVECIKTEEA